MSALIWAATWENRIFAYAKTKQQISYAVTAQPISEFVVPTWIYFLNPKFRASSHPLWLHNLVCVGPGREPWRPVFSERGLYAVGGIDMTSMMLEKLRRLRNLSSYYKYKCLKVQQKTVCRFQWVYYAYTRPNL